MKEITNFTARGGVLVSVRDSVTGKRSKTTWSGKAKRLWIKGSSLYDPVEVYELEPDEHPEPREGWSYALGFFG